MPWNLRAPSLQLSGWSRLSFRCQIGSLLKFMSLFIMLMLQDNVSLKNMDTSSLLDILHRPSHSSGPNSNGQPANGVSAVAGKPKGKAGSLKSILEGVEELWDNSEYAEEFSVDNFVQKLAWNFSNADISHSIHRYNCICKCRENIIWLLNRWIAWKLHNLLGWHRVVFREWIEWLWTLRTARAPSGLHSSCIKSRLEHWDVLKGGLELCHQTLSEKMIC